MLKGNIAGSVVRLIFLVLVIVLSFLLIFAPMWESYGSNDCVIYQSEVISNLKSSIESAKKTKSVVSRGFDLAQCVECIWYNKYDGQLMVKYTFKTGLLQEVQTMIVPYNVSSQFINLGCNCDGCDGCANMNEQKLYQFVVNETSVECTNCVDSSTPCGAAAVFSECTSDLDCYKGYKCENQDSAWDGTRCYSMDTIGNWIEFTDGPHWKRINCTKYYGEPCSNEKECSIYNGNDIEMHLGCQNTKLSTTKSCCLPLICNSYTGKGGNCDDERPADAILCNSNEDCYKVCGNVECGSVYDNNFNEYISCYLSPGESCKYGWQCGSNNKPLRNTGLCDTTWTSVQCLAQPGCEWCGCERCTESIIGTTHCYCLPTFTKGECDQLPDIARVWYSWVGCQGSFTEIAIPTTCSSGKCCINSGHSCRIADRDYCNTIYCCSSDAVIEDERCCVSWLRGCDENWQCCSGLCTGVAPNKRCSSDVTAPTYGSVVQNIPTTPTRGSLINVTVLWIDNGFLKTGVFKHNESGVWNSDEYSFTINPEWFDASILIGYVKGKICWKQEVRDMSDNLNNNMPEQCFDVT